MRVAWLSNAPHAQSGYAYQSEMFIRRLKRMGHQVICVTNSEFRDGPQLMVDNIVYFPGGRGQAMENRFGWEGALALCATWKPDVLFSLFDIWTFPKDFGKQVEKMGSAWAPICPVDHDPISPGTLEVLKNARYPIAMSRYGQTKMLQAGIMNPDYIPHGVDTSTFRPMPMESGVRAKLSNGEPDKFLVGMVAANQSYYDRKGWDELFQAWRKFHDKHSDTILYLHTIATDYSMGMPLDKMAHLNGVDFVSPDRWQYIDGFPTFNLARIINAFDVHILISRGEGFGIPTIEAQACGVPVITHDVCAQSELNGSGWAVKPARRVWSNQNAWQFLANIDDAVDKLCIAYQLWKKGNLAPYKSKARAFGVQYDIERVFGLYMVPFLDKVAKDAEARKFAEEEKKKAAVVAPEVVLEDVVSPAKIE